MNSKVITVAAALGLIACFSAGLAIGKRSSGQPPTDDTRAEAAGPVSALISSRGNRSERAGRALSKAARATDQNLFTKLRTYQHLVATAAPGEMASLIEAIAREVPMHMGRHQLLSAAATRWAQIDPDAALAAVISGSPRALRRRSSDMVTQLVADDPRRTLERLLRVNADGDYVMNPELTPNRRTSKLMAFLKELPKHDAHLAADVIASIQAPSTYKKAITFGLVELAKADPALAVRTLSQLPADLTPDTKATSSIFVILAETDRQTAIAAMRGLRRADRIEAARGILHEWAGHDPAAAYEWAKTLPPEERTAEVLYPAFSSIAADDSAAATRIFRAMTSPSDRAEYAPILTTRGLESDPAATLEWAREDLEGTVQQSAFERLLFAGGESYQLDVQLELANAISGKTSAIETFAERWAAQDPAAAAAWAIDRNQTAESPFENVAEIWASADIEAFESFADSLPQGALRRLAKQAILEANWEASRR